MKHSKINDTTNSKSDNKGLIITKASTKKLTKNQLEFNKLTLKIEKLQKDIEKKKDKLDLALKMYGNDLHPLKEVLLKEREQNLLILWQHYKSKKLSAKDQTHLKQIVREHLQRFFMELNELPSENVKAIFNELENDDYDKKRAEEKSEAAKNLKAALKKMKVDLSGIDTTNENELYDRLRAHQQKEFETNQNAGYNNKEKKKTAKQIEAEKIQQDAEELKQKNIGTIYKQLAKLFHPDLEQDESKKAEKALLMQELIAAYESKNLHALLTLELKWIHKENEHLESLTEEKLVVYLQILKDQIADLTFEKEEIGYMPQYAVLVENFGWEVKQAPIDTITRHLKATTNLINDFKLNFKLFKSDDALKYIKYMIKDWKLITREREEEELFRQLFEK